MHCEREVFVKDLYVTESGHEKITQKLAARSLEDDVNEDAPVARNSRPTAMKPRAHSQISKRNTVKSRLGQEDRAYRGIRHLIAQPAQRQV